MAIYPSAVHRVLALPELLDYILSFVYFTLDHPFVDSWGVVRGNNLVASNSIGALYVNRLWFSVAVKYVWRRCGLHPGPTRYDLAKLAMRPMRYIPPKLKMQSERLQFYADFIEEFDFEEVNLTSLHSGSDQILRLVRLKTLLPQLDLPRIRRISMTGSGISVNEQPNVLSFAIPFLRPSLRDLSITMSTFPSLLWTTLMDKCPQLERLVMSEWTEERPNPTYIADKACQTFISSAPNLKHLTFHEHRKLWSQAMFSSIAHNPSLESLTCNVQSVFVPDDWITDLPASKSFQTLQTLTLWTTSTGLNLLAPSLQNITNLSIRLDHGLTDSNTFNFHHFSNLEHFQLFSYETLQYTHEDTIEGPALLTLASSCPNLVTLKIDSECNTSLLSSVTDEIISTLTLSLPHLQEFALFGAYSPMTEASIFSFASNCKSLKSLHLSTSFDIVDLARSDTPGMFPLLEDFYLLQDGYKEWSSSLTDSEFRDIARRLAEMMPRAKEFAVNVWLKVEMEDSMGGEGSGQRRLSLDDAVRAVLGIEKGSAQRFTTYLDLEESREESE